MNMNQLPWSPPASLGRRQCLRAARWHANHLPMEANRPRVREAGSAGPGSYISVPTMLTQSLQQIGFQSGSVTQRDVRVHMVQVAHADDCGRDQPVGQNEAQGHFRQSHAVRHNRLERAYPFQGRRQVLRAEVPASPVSFRKARIWSQFSSQATLIKRNTGNDPNVHLFADAKQFVFRRLVEDVVDDLYRVHTARANGLDSVGRLPAIQAQTKMADEILALQPVHNPAPLFVFRPAVVPDMKLKQVDGVHFERSANELNMLQHVLFGKNVFVPISRGSRPFAVHRRNFRRRVQALMRIAKQELPKKAIAVALSIGPGGIEKVAAQIGRDLQGLSRALVVRSRPTAHSPKSMPNLTDRKICAT